MQEKMLPRPLMSRFLHDFSGKKSLAADALEVDLKTYLNMVAEDVELLCNTRSPTELIRGGGALPEFLTVADWGIPDWTGLSPYAPETVEWLCLAVQRSLTAFEPRLQEITVRPFKPEDEICFWEKQPDAKEGLYLRVEARLTIKRAVSVVLFLHLSESGAAASGLHYGL